MRTIIEGVTIIKRMGWLLVIMVTLIMPHASEESVGKHLLVLNSID